ncbi:hypothetical protein bcgnr5378_05010 [Bacillus cereus]|uniref:Uncharacterized protein n=1 Tax=Bacillus cereus TaxID=1396 RepID=A0A164LE48_BACCE|nr:hypothetical protein [Bacillus cereus]KZD55717.1 hypothetical protein B4088_5462 [Bacillus cereus]
MDESLNRDEQLLKLHGYITKDSNPIFKEMNMEQIEHFYFFYKPTVYIKKVGDREFEAYIKELDMRAKGEREIVAVLSLIWMIERFIFATLFMIDEGREFVLENIHYYMNMFLHSADGKTLETVPILRALNYFVYNDQGELESYKLVDSLDYAVYADSVTNHKIEKAFKLFQNKELLYTVDDVQRKTWLPRHIVESVYYELQQEGNTK